MPVASELLHTIRSPALGRQEHKALEVGCVSGLMFSLWLLSSVSTSV